MEGNPLAPLAPFSSFALVIKKLFRVYVKERPVVEGNPLRSCFFTVSLFPLTFW